MRSRSTTGPASISAVTSAARFGGDNSTSVDSRFLGGVQGGADYQFAPNWVARYRSAVQLDSSSNNSGVLFPGGVLVNSNSDQLGSVTGRLGYTFGPALLYAKGGYAWKDGDNLTVTVAGVPVGFATVGNHRDGYTVGAGARIHVRPELVGQDRIPVLQLRQHDLPDRSGRARWRRASTTTSTP